MGVKPALVTVLAVIAVSGFVAAVIVHPSTSTPKGSTVTVTTTNEETTTVDNGSWGFSWLYTNLTTNTYVNLFRIDGHTCVDTDQGGSPGLFCWKGP